MAEYRVKANAKVYWKGRIYGPGEIVEGATESGHPSLGLVEVVGATAAEAGDKTEKESPSPRRRRGRDRMIRRAPDRG